MSLRDWVVGSVTVVASFAAVGAFKAAVIDHGISRAAPGKPPVALATAAALPTRAPEPAPVAPLTGMPVGSPDGARRAGQRPIGVMVDNNEAAAPQAGLDRADVVIEALVEGGITRFMAIYESQDAERIEPVRSARTPFLHWALECDAIYAHVGSAEGSGPANAGQQILDWRVAALDMEGGPTPAAAAFSRDPKRAAPHNVATSTAALRKVAAGRGYDREPRFGVWRFAVSSGVGPGAPASSLRVGFGALSEFTARWDWEEASGTYRRSQFGASHVDAVTGRQLAARHVIVQFARSYVADANGHVLIDNVGEGRALVFAGGQVVEATWRKTDDASRTRFYGPEGEEMVFSPGNTWIEVVDLSGGVTME